MLIRLLAVLFYAALGVFILTFILSNRESITLDLFPLDLVIELPAYAALSILFAAGLLLGLLHSFSLWLTYQRRMRIARRSIAQLEQEIAIKSNSAAS